MPNFKYWLCLPFALLLSGCAPEMDDLETYIGEVKQRPEQAHAPVGPGAAARSADARVH